MKRYILFLLASLPGLLFFFPLSAQNLQWAIAMGGTAADAGQSVYVDDNDEVYVTGRFVGTADFDPGPGVQNLVSNGIGDIFLAKYDATGQLIWAHAFGSALNEVGLSVAGMPNGAVIMTGHFSGTIDFDPGPGVTNLVSNGQEDVFLATFDGNGNLLWARSFGGIGSDFGYYIDTDAAGNIALTGFYQNTVDFDPGPGMAMRTSNGGSDIYTARFDAAGNLAWINAVGGTDDDSGQAVRLDATGNVYITGGFGSSVDFDPGPGMDVRVSAGSDDLFLSKYDAAGNHLWTITAGSNAIENGEDLDFTATGNICLTGFFSGTVDFDPGPGVSNLVSAGGLDAFLATYDPNGNLIWADRMGGNATDQGNSLSVDDCGYIYVTGYFNGAADFDPGPGTATLNSAGGLDIFLARYDAAGNYSWAYPIGSGSNDFGLHLLLHNNNIYLTGYFEANVDFDIGTGTSQLNAAGSSDVFIARYSPCSTTANVLDVSICTGSSYTFFGTEHTESVRDTVFIPTGGCCDSMIVLDLTVAPIVQDVTDTICSGISYYVGNFTYSSTGQYQAILVSPGGCDSIINLNLTVLPPPEENVSATICSGISYYVGNFTYSSTGQYQALLVAPSGCDSIVNLDLTVTPPLENHITASICEGDSYPVGNSNYNQTGSYQNFLITPEGCDSIVFLDLTVHQPVEVDIAATICSDSSYMLGSNSYTVSGNYQEILSSVAGCDSTVNLALTVLSVAQNSIAESICEGMSYTFGNNMYSTSGIYQEIFTAANGCDSTVTLDLQVLPLSQSDLSAVICDGETYTLGSATYNVSGTYQEIFPAANGCDSVVTLALTVLPELGSEIQASICEGETFTLGANVYDQSGTYQETFISANGCDSTVTLNLTVIPVAMTQLNEAICMGTSFTVGDSVYSVSGIYQQTLSTTNGCDSIVELQLTVLPAPEITSTATPPLCPGESGTIAAETSGGQPPYLYAIDNVQFQDQPTFFNVFPGTYQLVVQDSIGCVATTEVTLLPAFPLDIGFADPMISIESGEEVLLSPVANFVVDTFFWTPDSTLDCPVCWQPIATPLQTTTYQLVAISENGCPVTASVRIEVHVVRR
ncbi:MAG: hypothetical protein R2791_22475, partial [Saprospiraceae bacterium]